MTFFCLIFSVLHYHQVLSVSSHDILYQITIKGFCFSAFYFLHVDLKLRSNIFCPVLDMRHGGMTSTMVSLCMIIKQSER